MTKVIEVLIDDSGHVLPLDPEATVPKGRARLLLGSDADISSYLLSEAALAEDWLRPEEEEAWAYLQPAK